ncbi:GWxTD domain-containing protein [candidate division KSB1 bacterium]|nr:GWxTD domain-containing protein [candidate division KSB1 bacterium]
MEDLRYVLRSWSLFILIGLFVGGSYGQESTLQLSLDMAQFQDPKGQAYLEIYYALQEHGIKYMANEDGKLTSQVIMNMLVFQNDSLWASKAWKIEKALQDSSNLQEGRQIVDLFRYYVDVPATYRVVMHARDLNQENVIDSVEVEMKCEAFSETEVEVSDLQLATKIKRMDKTAPKVFAKRNYAVTPNPEQIFGEGVPTLYYYFESYNLKENVAGNLYERLAYLKNESGKIVEGLGSTSRTQRKMHDNSVEMGMMNISNVPTGSYSFVYGIADTAGSELSLKEKPVYIYNPSVVPPALATQGSSEAIDAVEADLQGLSEEELDKEFENMIYLVDKEEIEFYANLKNTGAKREYIASIWRDQARLEGTFPIEFRVRYLKRVNEATQLFKEPGRKGWETDRGRVYVVYGPPTTIDRIRSSAQNKPYQIWTYDSLRGQGGVEFVFADRFGFSKFELLHSTLRGELQDPNWQRFVVFGPGGNPFQQIDQ